MKNLTSLSLCVLLCLATGILSLQKVSAQSSVPDPASHFGFEPGSDYMLFNYDMLIDYLQKLDKASPMLKLVENGQTPMGRKMYILFISSEKTSATLINSVK